MSSSESSNLLENSLSRNLSQQSEDDIPLEKVRVAGSCKSFVGNGRHKITKEEIKRSDIARLTEKVFNLAGETSYRSLSTHCLGLCRIQQKAATFLLEDLGKFNDKLNAALIGDRGTFSKSKKDKKRRESEEEEAFLNMGSPQSMQLCNEADIALLFSRNLPTDRHLMEEIPVRTDLVENNLGHFGDEIHLQRRADLWSPPLFNGDNEMAQLAKSIINNHQVPGGGFASTSTTCEGRGTETNSPRSTERNEGGDETLGYRSVTGTPKRRKTRQYQEETPKKRQRKSPSRPAAGRSEERSTTGPVRRLFNQNNQRFSTTYNPEEISTEAPEAFYQGEQRPSMAGTEIRHGVGVAEGNQGETFHEQIPYERSNEEGRRSSSHQLPPYSQSTPIPSDVLEGAQLGPNQFIEDIDVMELEELDPIDAASTPRRRRRSKKWKWQDEIKKVPKPLDINNRENFVNVHTREFGSTLVNLQKQSVTSLFSLPAARINPRGPCAFGKTLLNLYFEMARPILPTNNAKTPGSSSLPRDVNVHMRQRRYSTFGQRASAPSTSGDQNVEAIDRELMPPPPSPAHVSGSHGPRELPEITIELPQSPRTPNRPSIRPDTPGVSPRQSPSVPNNIEPAVANVSEGEAVNPPDLPLAASHRTDDDSDPQSHYIIEISPSSISTTSERERSLLMDEDSFYQFLKNAWENMFNQVYLENIIPRRPTLVAFFRYFVFLQRLQKKGKLTMLQPIIYGPVQIVREREE